MLKNRSFDVILAENVFHFLHDHQIQEAFLQTNVLLKPNGLFFATFCAPYLNFLTVEFRQKFDIELALFLYCVANGEKPIRLPGYAENVRKYVDEAVLHQYGMSSDEVGVPLGHYFFFHYDTVCYFLKNASLEVLHLNYVSTGQPIFNVDGREFLHCVACKPNF